MSTFEHELVNHLVKNHRYTALQEYVDTVYPEKNTKVIVQEYVGSEICVRKQNHDIQIFCPKNMSVIQESALTHSIENGTIFDDADDVENVTQHIVATAVPTNALINTGKSVPSKINGVVSMVVGRMGDDGRCSPDETDVENGQNMIKDLVDAKANEATAKEVINHYIGNDEEEPIGPEMAKECIAVESEIDDIQSVKPEDSITDNDYTELDPMKPQPPTKEDIDNGWNDIEVGNTSNEEYDDDDIGGQTPIEQPTYQQFSNDDAPEFDDLDAENTEDEEESDPYDDVEDPGQDINFQQARYMLKQQDIENDESDYEDMPIEEEVEKLDTMDSSMDLSTNDIDTSMMDTNINTDVGTSNLNTTAECGTNGVPIGQNATPAPSKTTVESWQEGFLSKKPKKLKPIPREVIAYITVELNNVQDANDQAMLAGYTCSKLELVDFYLNCIDTNDPRYIVPHNKQYLEQMQRELNSLLAQILRIRPINKSDRIWNVNYPY